MYHREGKQMTESAIKYLGTNWGDGGEILEDSETRSLAEWPCEFCCTPAEVEYRPDGPTDGRLCFASFGPKGSRVSCRKRALVYCVNSARLL